MSTVPFLHARDLVKVYGDRRVLDAVSLSAAPGHRLGLVGENGVGKSTLLRLLAGVEEPDDGEVHRPADIGFLWQELPFPAHAPVRAVLDDALRDIRAATARLDHLTALLAADPGNPDVLAEYGDLLDWAQDHDAWDADRRAELVLTGLGLASVDTARPLAGLSGGQRSRLGLAALLIRRPRALVLDEPTNHLDDEAVAFLERALRDLPGAVVLASHDRVFLDEVCTDIVDLDPALEGPTRHGGAYSDYLEAKRLHRVRWEQRHAAEQEELTRLRDAVDTTARHINHARVIRDNNKVGYDRKGGRVQSQISRRVRNAQNRLDELTATQVRRPPPPLRFAATLTTDTPAADAPLALSLHDVHVTGRLHIESLEITPTTRLLVTGPNGAGKSTLLTLLTGHLRPDSGEVHRADNLRVALLAQDVDFPDPRATPRTLYTTTTPDDAVPLADLGLLPTRDLDRPVGHLSVGQRRRVALALLIAAPPDVLVLDEPTNHFSLTLAEELEDALDTAPGALVLASHDRWLRRSWQGRELRLADGRPA